MIAEIKFEKRGRLLADTDYVCLIGGVSRFRFSSVSGRVEDVQTGSGITCDEHKWFFVKRIYVIPGLAKFEIGYRSLDGVRPEEDWPTPFQQCLVLGPHRFFVDPIDSHLSFEWRDDPSLDFPGMIFAFNLHSLYGSGD